MYGLLGALGAIGLSMSTDKSVYLVGEKPTYLVTGAQPASVIAWTSFKDGKHTGEFQTVYPEQKIAANGTLEVVGAAFTEQDVGQWQKQLAILAPDTSTALAQASFVVRATAPPPPPGGGTSPAGGGFGDFFDDTIELPLIGDVPLWIALAGGVGAFWFFTRKR